MIGMKVTGVEALIARLRNTAVKVPENARKVMHRGADRIVAEAKLNAPVDRHNLEEAIHKEVGYETNRRLKIDIAVAPTVNGVDVEDYAAQVHENYESMKPGKGTIEKRRANPGRLIGSKFLERALEAEEPRLRKAMIEAVEEG